MRRIHQFWTAVSLAAALSVAACAAQPPSCPYDADYVAISASSGDHCFGVEIADSARERMRGLMYVRHMESDRGMLFLFDEPEEQSFWMKNTYISLDIIFIAPDGRIANIAARTEPLSENSVPSVGPVTAVLEINGGLAEKLGLTAGDRVRHPALAAMTGERSGR